MLFSETQYFREYSRAISKVYKCSTNIFPTEPLAFDINNVPFQRLLFTNIGGELSRFIFIERTERLNWITLFSAYPSAKFAYV